jgi:hypothetical protein
MGGAIVKARYGRGGGAIGAAKAHVRYMAHRPDPWGNVPYRELWSADERLDKRGAYDALDRAVAGGSYVYRLVLSPDPREQDASQELDLRAWSEAAMDAAAAAHPGLYWFAVEHQDPDHRHVHVVALSQQRLDVDDFRSMRMAADDNAREQLRQRERSQDLERDR